MLVRLLEFGEEIGVIEKEAFHSTVEDNHFHLLVGFERRQELPELLIMKEVAAWASGAIEASAAASR